jgi:hypothetical protein
MSHVDNLMNKSHFIKGKRERSNAEIGMGKAELTSRLKIERHPHKNQPSIMPPLAKKIAGLIEKETCEPSFTAQARRSFIQEVPA